MKMFVRSIFFATIIALFSPFDALTEPMTPAQIELAFQKVVKNLNMADEALEDLAQKVNNNAILNIDKPQVKQQIRDLRMLIDGMRSGSHTHINESNLKTLILFNDALTQVLQTAIESGLRTIPPLPIEQLATRSVQELNFQEATATLAEQEKKLQKIEAQAINVGLGYFNRTYRALEKFENKYHVARRTIELTAILAALGIIVYNSDESRFTYSDKIKKIKLFLGLRKPKIVTKTFLKFFKSREILLDYQGQEIKETSGLYGSIENFIRSNTLYWTLATALLPTMKSLFRNDLSALKKYAKEKWTGAKNKMRGGPPRGLPSWKKAHETAFKDVIGMEHAKREMLPYFEYLLNPEKFDQAGNQPPKGILLYGPSRTGKTFFVEAFFGELEAQLKEAGVSNHKFKYWHVTRDTFKLYGDITTILSIAKLDAPGIVFIDEIDLLRLQRDQDVEALNRFLVGMSGCLSGPPDKQIILICATNRPDLLDFALLNRFGKSFFVGKPCQQDRLKFFRRELEKRIIDTRKFDLAKLARETDDCTYEQLKTIIKTASQYARMAHTTVTQEHFEICIDQYIRKILPPVKQLSAQEQHSIASYQAGKALATLLLNTSERLIKVTTLPITKQIVEDHVWNKTEPKYHEAIEYGKCFTYHETDTLHLHSEKQLQAHIKFLLAGYAAEKVMIGSTTYSYHAQDKEKALKFAKQFTFKGIDEKSIPKEMRETRTAQAIELVEQYEQEVTQLLMQQKPLLERVTVALLEKHILSAEEIAAIMLQQLVPGLQLPSPEDENGKERALSDEPVAATADGTLEVVGDK